LTERFGDDAEGLLAELDAAGIDRRDFGRFGQVAEIGMHPPNFDYATAAPILIEWLPRVRAPGVKEAIARSLTGETAASETGAKALVDEFRKAPSNNEWTSAKWAFGLALSTVADASVADDLIDLVQDSRHGMAREMLCEALRRTNDPRAPDVLIELIHDPELGGHAIHALRSYGPKSSLPHLRRARPELEKVLEDATATDFARRMAKKSLERLDASAEAGEQTL
jgi:HEAT repeat protein